MEEIIYSDELINLAGDLEIGLITLDRDGNVVSCNEIARPHLRKVTDDIKKKCPENRSDCRHCALGDSFICRESSGGGYRNIYFRVHYMEEYNDKLLKESERLKRILLDNMNSSFLIVDRRGNVERCHFVGDLSILLGQRSASSNLGSIFNDEIKERVLAKLERMESIRSREMSHFRFDLNSQLLWLDFYMVKIGNDSFFLNIDDKTGEHYLMERLDRLSEVELGCLKVDDLGDKISNLVSGILGYSEMAISKNDCAVVGEILDSIRKISSDSLNLLKLMKGYTGQSPNGENREVNSLSSGTVEKKRSGSGQVDADKAVQNLENNWELYQTVTADFCSDYGDIPEKLPPLYASSPDEARILIHSIKGVAGILGAFNLQNEANILEGYLRKDERREAENMMPRFIETLRLVLDELSSLNRAEGKGEGTEKEDLSLLVLDNHQKELLKENLCLTEYGDYNGLMNNFNQYASFDWGEDWYKTILSLREYVENIDFDGVRDSIIKLIR